MNDVTRVLSAMEHGDSNAADQLLPLVYEGLRRLAAQQMAEERPGHTLNATGLVHEAYVRLVDRDQRVNWNSRGHFYAAAAEAMRRILVERAREKSSMKGGGDICRHDLTADLASDAGNPQEILDLHEALLELESCNEEAARLVKLRYFAGLSHTQAADAMQISRRTADRLWILAKTWLLRQMSRS